MAHSLIYSFPENRDAPLSQVGGKGLSLIQASNQGLPVPPGFILSVAFFAPWISELKKTNHWSHFLKATDKELPHICETLKKEALNFTFNQEQKTAIADALKNFSSQLFAVRSSSPNEDLEGASFAGGYETILGVTKETLEKAVKRTFASCLDYRVVVYKRENGFAIDDPQIAVIIQQQIASEVAGVGFSLNPITNNYDEAVFNANWGLGETVVAGLATPDTFVVDKVHEAIKQTTIGGKELSILLTSKGGTEEKKHFRSKEKTLSNEKIIALTQLIKKVEQYYKKPMDIEWAYKNEQLFLLQARPITTYVPLASDLRTNPGSKKRLYLDVTVTAQAMNKPVSKMGTSLFRQLLKIIGKIIAMRDITTDIEKTIGWISEGKIFINLSNAFALAGKKKVVRLLTIIDPLGAKSVEQLDEKVYTSSTSKLFLLPLGLLRRLPGLILFIHQAKKHPDEMHRRIQESLKAFEHEAKNIAEKDIPLHQLIDELIYHMFMQVFRKTVPLTLVSRITLNSIKKLVEDAPEVEQLQLALPHNMTTEMGLELSHLANLLPDNQTKPPEFLHAWQQFLERYGHRGPAEIDLASPRYRDNPELLLNLLLAMKKTPGENAQEKFDRNQQERQKAYQSLHQKLLKKNAKLAQKFAHDYHFFETFGGYRETHKYYLVFVVDILRQKVLKQAETLVATKRLDTIEQVFDLTIDQLDEARRNTSLDLRKLAKSNTVFLKQLARVSLPPSIIDSRGFIPQPPIPQAREGYIVGTPISPGSIKGRVKILHTPDEKPLNKGEILVARATDPGWTPLFVNAAGVILEIGGVLQHGALVAREYGLPCVSGIANATKLWKDGTLIELDGSAGTIRIL